MFRVELTADDVAAIRFSTSPAPMTEAVMAFAEVRRAAFYGELRRIRDPDVRARPRAEADGAAEPGESFSWRRDWLRQMATSFPAGARPLLDLMPPGFPTPEFLDPAVADVEEGLALIRAAPRELVRADLARCWRDNPVPKRTPPLWVRNLADGDREAREVVATAMGELYHGCVGPFWGHVTQCMRADLATRLPALATGGYAGLFASIHPQLRWHDRGLERATGSGRHELGGTGLRLFPSAFWSGQPMFAIRPPELGGNALVYPAHSGAGPAAPVDGTGNHGNPGNPGNPGDRDLAGLLGHTRAETLRLLQQPCGTTELAGRLHVSVSSASEHVAALRGAGLVRSERDGRAVRHWLTPLGRALLGRPLARRSALGEVTGELGS